MADQQLNMDAHDQLPDESDKAYAAFLEYCELGPHDRSLAKVAERLGKSETLMARWSSKHEWPRRVRSWDRAERALIQEAKIDLYKEMDDRHMKIAQTVQRIALDRLSHMQPEELSASQVLNYFVRAIHIERLASQRPTEIVGFEELEHAFEEEYDDDTLKAWAEETGIFDRVLGGIDSDPVADATK